MDAGGYTSSAGVLTFEEFRDPFVIQNQSILRCYVGSPAANIRRRDMQKVEIECLQVPEKIDLRPEMLPLSLSLEPNLTADAHSVA